MNRPGQPQQRPPNLAQNPGLSSQFRPPYPAYGMPPRNVNPLLQSSGYGAGLQPNSHRAPAAQQSQVQSINPGFMQQRAQSGFGFANALGQHQSSATIQQQSSSHQQQANGSSTSLPPHLTQTQNLGAPSASSADVGLDPNDFPALGSATTNNPSTPSANGNNAGSSVTTSYATQAGTGAPLTGGIGAGGSMQQRDFTPDDFPALGGQPTQQSSQNQHSGQESQSHPPGLNGFQHSEHRQNLIGSLSGGTTPGMLNIGQSRNVHPGFQQSGQSEADKQQQRNNYALKLNQVSHAAWNSPTAPTPGSFSTTAVSSTPSQQNGSHPNAPPGVPPPPYSQQAQSAQSGQAQYASNGTAADSHSNANLPLNSNNSGPHQNPASLPTGSLPHAPSHPQTPAQQVLVSAADRWGLLGLLAMLKNVGTDLDQGMVGIGTDLGMMGLDMAYHGDLYPTFITPWADPSAARTVEPDFHLPSCYASVHAAPPGPNKATAFSDETLFFMFYSSPRDALQEIAAQELWNRNWRYHKDLRLWITKESGTTPSQKVPGGEQGLYTFWDPENWTKERKEMTVLYADLEEKTVPAFVQGPGLVLAPTATQGQVGAGQQHQAQVGGGQVPRASFQMSMGGL